MKYLIVSLAACVVQGLDIEIGATCIPGNKQGYGCAKGLCCGAKSANITPTSGSGNKATKSTAPSSYICNTSTAKTFIEELP